MINATIATVSFWLPQMSIFLKMVPLVSRSVATLVDTFAEGAASGKSIEVFK